MMYLLVITLIFSLITNETVIIAAVPSNDPANMMYIGQPDTIDMVHYDQAILDMFVLAEFCANDAERKIIADNIVEQIKNKYMPDDEELSCP